jgi:hypothetical protein
MNRGSSTVSEAGEFIFSPTADTVGESPDDRPESDEEKNMLQTICQHKQLPIYHHYTTKDNIFKNQYAQPD